MACTLERVGLHSNDFRSLCASRRASRCSRMVRMRSKTCTHDPLTVPACTCCACWHYSCACWHYHVPAACKQPCPQALPLSPPLAPVAQVPLTQHQPSFPTITKRHILRYLFLVLKPVLLLLPHCPCSCPTACQQSTWHQVLRAVCPAVMAGLMVVGMMTHPSCAASTCTRCVCFL